jgi:hypothetical protein
MDIRERLPATIRMTGRKRPGSPHDAAVGSGSASIPVSSGPVLKAALGSRSVSETGMPRSVGCVRNPEKRERIKRRRSGWNGFFRAALEVRIRRDADSRRRARGRRKPSCGPGPSVPRTWACRKKRKRKPSGPSGRAIYWTFFLINCKLIRHCSIEFPQVSEVDHVQMHSADR